MAQKSVIFLYLTDEREERDSEEEEEAHLFFDRSGSEDDDKATNLGYGNPIFSSIILVQKVKFIIIIILTSINKIIYFS